MSSVETKQQPTTTSSPHFLHYRNSPTTNGNFVDNLENLPVATGSHNRFAGRLAKGEKRRHTDGNVHGTLFKLSTAKSAGSDCDIISNEKHSLALSHSVRSVDAAASLPTTTGKRYITRPSRTATPNLGAGNNSDSSTSSPLKSTNCLKSPLKSPSYSNRLNSLSPQKHHFSQPRGNLPHSSSSSTVSSPSPTKLSNGNIVRRKSLSFEEGEQTNGNTQESQQPQLQHVRTTKASRLRAAALDKKKDESFGLNSRQTLSSPSRKPPMENSSSSSEPEGPQQSFKPLSLSPHKKLVPNISISMKQSLNELQFNGTVCLPAKKDEQAAGDTNEELATTSRPRSSTLNKNPLEDKCDIVNGILELELSPVRSPRVPLSPDDRDKSAKRKSNLNRALNEECIENDDLSVTRRRRRMARQLVPEDATAALKEVMSPSEEQEKHISFEEAKTPILRKKSSEENHIVSILKKNNPESATCSSPVTFSSSVVDTPTHSSKQGILKKRSSLDESRYYSRSHSPDERSILIKAARRNSLEASAADQLFGILKHSNSNHPLESKSDGCPSVNESIPQGILKKRDSPHSVLNNQSKHVSISQAVILAAAELSASAENQNTFNEEFSDLSLDPHDIKPILKESSLSFDSQESVRAPKPILKKNLSSETEEIRPILKSSRKSSREESTDSEIDNVRPILKTGSCESPKRRSLIRENIVHPRSRSLENSSSPYQIFVEQGNVGESEERKSLAERIFNWENKTLEDSQNDARKPTETSIPLASRIHSLENDLLKPLEKPPRRSMNHDVPIAVRMQRLVTLEDSQNDVSNPIETSIPLVSRIHSLERDLLKPVEKPQRRFMNHDVPISVRKQRFVTQPVTSQEFWSSLQAIGKSPVTRRTEESCGVESVDSGLQQTETDSSNSISLMSSGVGGFTSGKTAEESVGKCNDNETAEVEMRSHSPALIRKNSVRARANMFQSLQEQQQSPRGSFSRDDLIGSPATRRAFSQRITSETETVPQTPQAQEDDEFEPSSLPVSERLRFFSNLSQCSSIKSSTPTSPAPSEFRFSNTSFSPSTTPRSSIAESTTNGDVKPLPKTRARKINMPDFLNDKNNNNITHEEDHLKNRVIGRIKSPFIEHSNNIMKNSENTKEIEVKRNSSFNRVKVISKVDQEESTDTNGDSGKENNENGIVSEARKKFTRAISLTQTVNVLQKSQSLVSNSRNLSISNSSSHVEKKFAKYFGVQVKAELSPIPKQSVLVNSKSFNQIQSPLLNSTANTPTTIKRRTTESHHIMISPKKYRSKTLTNGFPSDKKPITSYEDLQVTKEDLLNASKEFEKLFLGVE